MQTRYCWRLMRYVHQGRQLRATGITVWFNEEEPNAVVLERLELAVRVLRERVNADRGVSIEPSPGGSLVIPT